MSRQPPGSLFISSLVRLFAYLLFLFIYARIHLLNIYYVLTVFEDWNDNVELCLELSESISPWALGEAGTGKCM